MFPCSEIFPRLDPVDCNWQRPCFIRFEAQGCPAFYVVKSRLFFREDMILESWNPFESFGDFLWGLSVEKWHPRYVRLVPRMQKELLHIAPLSINGSEIGHYAIYRSSEEGELVWWKRVRDRAWPRKLGVG